MNENIEYLVTQLRKQEQQLNELNKKFSMQQALLDKVNEERYQLNLKVSDQAGQIIQRQHAWERQCAELRKVEVRYEDCRNQLSRAEENVAKLNDSFREQESLTLGWMKRAEKAERILRDANDYNFWAVPDYGPKKVFLYYRCTKSCGRPEVWNPMDEVWVETRFQSAQVLLKKFGKLIVESNAQEIAQCLEQEAK